MQLALAIKCWTFLHCFYGADLNNQTLGIHISLWFMTMEKIIRPWVLIIAARHSLGSSINAFHLMF